MIDKSEDKQTSHSKIVLPNRGKQNWRPQFIDDYINNGLPSSVLAFDAYGNLTTDKDPNTKLKHEVLCLDEFDEIISSFENGSKFSAPGQECTSNSIAISQKKQKRIKHNSSSVELALSDEDLKQAFTSGLRPVSATSRYGRTRKAKTVDEGFLFGTLNFNQLRKITSVSPKKTKTSCMNKSDSELFATANKSDHVYQKLDIIPSKVPISTSEDEFQPELATKPKKKRLKSKSLTKPVTINDSDDDKAIISKPKRRSQNFERTQKRKHSNNSFRESGKRQRKHKLSDVQQCNGPSVDVKDRPFADNDFDSDDDLPLNIFSSKTKIVQSPSLTNQSSIEDDIFIIKNSVDGADIGESEVNQHRSVIDRHGESDECPTNLVQAGLKTDFDTEYSKIEETEHEVVIKMETLAEEVKNEDVPIKRLTKYGRIVKKPTLIDISMEDLKEKVAREKQRNDIKPEISIIEEGFLETLEPVESENEGNVQVKYMVGDLVWVALRGSPLWPAIVTNPEGGKSYTSVNQKSPSRKGVRLYHVHFLCDGDRILWARSQNLLLFESLTSLISYLDVLKLEIGKKKIIPQFTKNLLESSLKTLTIVKKNSSSLKLERWHSAIQEAEELLKLDRLERLQKILVEKEIEEEKKKVKKKLKMKKSSLDFSIESVIADSECSIGIPECNIGISECSSLEEFPGFEESSFNTRENPLNKHRKRNKYIDKGDFEIYFHRHICDLMMKQPDLPHDVARRRLLFRWRKLSQLERAKYKVPEMFLNLDVDDSDSCSSSSGVQKITIEEYEIDDGSKGTYKIVRNEKVCILCETISCRTGGSDMIKCKGPCCSFFHKQCVGVDHDFSGEYRCNACISGMHSCFICKSSEGDEVVRCSVISCGKFYHNSCVQVLPQVSKARHLEKFVCPRHICHMCSANADDMNDPAAKTPPFTRCIRCPTTYHTGEVCISAGVEEISQNFHICTKHMKLPKNNNLHCNVNWCFCCSKGGSLLLCDQCPAAFHAECMNITAPEEGYVCEDCENGKFPVYGDIVWVKLGNYRWWPGQVLHPRYIPDNIDHLTHEQGMFCVHFFGSDDYYWVSRGRAFHYQEGDQGSKGNSSRITEQKFQRALDIALVEFKKQKERRCKIEESRSLKGKLKPAPYVRIDTNKPVGNVKLGKLDPSSVTKCDCDPYSENPCGSDDKCINRMLMVECLREVCPGGDRCKNQRFQRRQYPSVYPFRTAADRGWGLKTKDFIKKGDFVIEYVGELIDEVEFRRRIEEMHECKEENYYFLTVETDRMIDAGPKGNLARFMNNSCQPNCETQKWTVGADTRVGLFAIDEIAPESELTFNYNLECVGSEKKVCHCGAPNCSGFIGAKVQKVESGIKKVKKKKMHKKRKEKDTDDECFRCGVPGNLILCDVALCPKGYHLECLGLESLPKGKWLCPWHHCDECGGRSASRCLVCPNSYCRSHAPGKFNSEPGLENICLDHDSPEIEALKDRMGNSLQREAALIKDKSPPKSSHEPELIISEVLLKSETENIPGDDQEKHTNGGPEMEMAFCRPKKRGRPRLTPSHSPLKATQSLNRKREMDIKKRILRSLNHNSSPSDAPKTRQASRSDAVVNNDDILESITIE